MMKRFYGIVFLSALLAGCGTVHSHNNDYLQARTAPPLKMPPGVSNSQFQAYYSIPGHITPNTQPIELLPPGFQKQADIEKQLNEEWWKNHRPQSVAGWLSYWFRDK
ncbi:MAG: hypothetical protein ACE365_02560 [Gammaproteobacteria bacterium]